MSASSVIHSTAPTADSNASTSARCSGETRGFAIATVMARPIAAGVFGMARTSAAPGRLSARNRNVRPAMMDRTTVASATNGARAVKTSGAICGLTASTAAATSPTESRGGLRRTPRSVSAAMPGLGCGSRTTTFAGESPSATQASSMAPPILPAPASKMVFERPANRRGVCGFAAELIICARAQVGVRAGPGSRC